MTSKFRIRSRPEPSFTVTGLCVYTIQLLYWLIVLYFLARIYMVIVHPDIKLDLTSLQHLVKSHFSIPGK